MALASPNTQALQGASGGPQTFTLSALPPSSVMSASGNPPGSTLVSVIPSQGGMIQQQQGASQASAQQILEAGSGTGQFQFTTLNQLPIDLHSGGATGTVTTPGNAEESGVLLCNLDELSRYVSKKIIQKGHRMLENDCRVERFMYNETNFQVYPRKFLL